MIKKQKTYSSEPLTMNSGTVTPQLGAQVWREIDCEKHKNNSKVYIHETVHCNKILKFHYGNVALPHCHNGPSIFLVILNSVILKRKLRAP